MSQPPQSQPPNDQEQPEEAQSGDQPAQTGQPGAGDHSREQAPPPPPSSRAGQQPYYPYGAPSTPSYQSPYAASPHQGQYAGQYPGQYPGQNQGQYYGQYPGQNQGQYPGQYPDAYAGQYGEQYPVAREGGFFSDLFDFSFTRFVTPRIVKVVYIIAIVLIVLSYLTATIGAFSASVIGGSGSGIFTMIIGLFVALAAIIAVRLGLEATVALIRIAENTARTDTHGDDEPR